MGGGDIDRKIISYIADEYKKGKPELI